MRLNLSTATLGPALGTVAVAALWGTSGAWIRGLSASPAVVACFRAGLGAVALSFWLMVRFRVYRSDLRTLARGYLPSLLLSGVLLAVHWLTLVMALRRAPIGTVLTGVYLAPVVVAMFAYPVLKERVGAAKVTALAVTVCGSVLLLRPGSAGGWASVALILCSAAAYGGSIVASKHALTSVPAVVVGTAQLVLTALLLIPLTFVAPEPISTNVLVVLIVLGVVYSGVALLAYLECLSRMSATTSGVLLCLEPVAAFITGWLVFCERPSPLTCAGAMLVLAGGIVATFSTSTHTGREHL